MQEAKLAASSQPKGSSAEHFHSFITSDSHREQPGYDTATSKLREGLTLGRSDLEFLDSLLKDSALKVSPTLASSAALGDELRSPLSVSDESAAADQVLEEVLDGQDLGDDVEAEVTDLQDQVNSIQVQTYVSRMEIREKTV